MIRPTMFSGSAEMVSPISTLPKASGTYTRYHRLAFQPSTLLPTCFFLAMVSLLSYLFYSPIDL